MNQYARNYGYAPAKADMAVDAGLRAFMVGVFNKMALGLAVSGGLAWVAGNVAPVTQLIFGTPLFFVVAFAPLVLLLGAGFVMKNPSPAGTGLLYWSIVALMGLSLGSVFLVYTDVSVVRTFFITAAAFGALALWGYTTKKDLTGFGSFLIMGLFGLIIASLVNMFFKSDMMSFIISVVGVLVFSGLVAFDTQRLKYTYYELGGDQRGMAVATNYGALSLYINFINLFQMLLSLLGDRE
ncbi:MAG TPA: hypothetical protein DCZ49_04950 [Hyphomonadaceae bacterium]|jgi:Integral membrane protein, interacts with FtsH|nr:hypothetical protein [Hyphomonadaceae bacterium]